MRSQDFVKLIAQSVAAHRMRSSLTALGIGIGVTAVVLLTSIGEGLNHYIVDQFTQFGTHHARGAARQVEHVRRGARRAELDAAAVRSPTRRRSRARRTCCTSVPIVTGSGSIEGQRPRAHGQRLRRGAPSLEAAFKFNVKIGGRFLPPDRARARTTRGRARLEGVLRALRHEQRARRARVRIGGERYQIVGIMETKGDMVGVESRRHRIHPGRARPRALQSPGTCGDRRAVRGERSERRRGGRRHQADPGRAPRRRGLHDRPRSSRCSTCSARSSACSRSAWRRSAASRCSWAAWASSRS